MPANRYFLPTPFTERETHHVTGEELHHLARVMRKKGGDTIELVNGQGALATALITELSSRKATVSLTRVERTAPLLPPLILIQALLPLPQLKLIVQKTTELGVSDLFFFPACLSEKSMPTLAHRERLHATAIAALKQCGRLDLPTMTFLPDLSHLPSLDFPLFFGDLRAEAPWLKASSSLARGGGMMIGPEKGWTERELILFEKNHRAQGVKLHPYTLRAETAAIAAIAALSQLMV